MWCLTRILEPQEGRTSEHRVGRAASLNLGNSPPESGRKLDLRELARAVGQHIGLGGTLRASRSRLRHAAGGENEHR
jgi:hypothetical protein